MSPSDEVAISPDGLGQPPEPRSWIPVAVVLIGGAIVLVAALWVWQRSQHERVRSEEAWLTAGLDGDRIDLVSRGSGDVYFQVRLLDVPLGERLALECEWLDPDGVAVHHNRYKTRTVERDPWPTHCKHSFGSSAAAGSWRVQMTLDGRWLIETAFVVH